MIGDLPTAGYSEKPSPTLGCWISMFFEVFFMYPSHVVKVIVIYFRQVVVSIIFCHADLWNFNCDSL